MKDRDKLPLASSYHKAHQGTAGTHSAAYSLVERNEGPRQAGKTSIFEMFKERGTDPQVYIVQMQSSWVFWGFFTLIIKKKTEWTTETTGGSEASENMVLDP